MKAIKVMSMALAIVMLLLSFVACGHKHTWVNATCTEPKTCSECGETEGEPLGHAWKEATCTEPKTCSACGITEGKALGHTWTDATCTEPQTCSTCGETKGEPKGHRWVKATCEAPKTCSVCGETEGDLADHTWKEATCVSPKTCSVCGLTDGEALGHEAGDWEVVKQASLSSDGIEQIKCTRCGSVLEEKRIDKKNIEYKNGLFNVTRRELIDYLADEVFNKKYNFYDSGELDPFGGYACSVSDNGEQKVIVSFVENGSGQVKSIVVWGQGQEALFHAVFIYTAICGHEDATAKSEEIFDNLQRKGSCLMDGFRMTMKNAGDGFYSFTIVGE